MCQYGPGDYVTLRSGKRGTILAIVDRRPPTYYEIALDDGQIIRLDSLAIVTQSQHDDEQVRGQQALLVGLPRSRLIYHSFVDEVTTDFFFLSNENDWTGIRDDAPEAGTVVSFSNNVGWDLALECNATRLVLVDYQLTPLLVQELIFRPLILVSRTPLEFLCAVLGEPQKLDEEATIDDLKLPKYGGFCESLEDLELFHTSILLRAKQAKLPIVWLSQYFAAIRKGRCSGTYGDYPFVVNKRRVMGQIHLALNERDMGFELCSDLLARYRGKTSTCLSSVENFGRLRQLFRQGVYYAKGNLQEACLWRSLAVRVSLMDLSITVKSCKVTVHISNVCEYLLYTAGRSRVKMKKLPYEALLDLSALDRYEIKQKMRAHTMSFLQKMLGAFVTGGFTVGNLVILFTTGGMEAPVHEFFQCTHKGIKKL